MAWTDRDGNEFDDTANPAVWTPTRQTTIAQAIDNGRFLGNVKTDGVMTNSDDQFVDRDGMSLIRVVRYFGGTSALDEGPGKRATLVTVGSGFEGTNVGGLTSALKYRFLAMRINGIKLGADATVIPGGADIIKLGTQTDIPQRDIVTFDSGGGVSGYAGTPNGNRVELLVLPYTDEASRYDYATWGTNAELIVFYVHDTAGDLRMYWSGSSSIAVDLTIEISAKYTPA